MVTCENGIDEMRERQGDFGQKKRKKSDRFCVRELCMSSVERDC